MTNASQEGGRIDYNYIFDRIDVRIIFLVLYTFIFCFCFFGNLMVILVVCLHWRMRSITKFCLANLAVADLCVGIFCVYQNLVTYLVDSWIFGEFMCKMFHFINSLSTTASVLILVVICVERYLAIVYPLTCKRNLTKTRLRMIILLVWILSAAISSPRFYYFNTISMNLPHNKTEILCLPNRTKYSSKLLDMISMTVLFLIPLAIITILYTQIGIVLWRSDSIRIPPKTPSPSSSMHSLVACCPYTPAVQMVDLSILPLSVFISKSSISLNESKPLYEYGPCKESLDISINAKEKAASTSATCKTDLQQSKELLNGSIRYDDKLETCEDQYESPYKNTVVKKSLIQSISMSALEDLYDKSVHTVNFHRSRSEIILSLMGNSFCENLESHQSSKYEEVLGSKRGNGSNSDLKTFPDSGVEDKTKDMSCRPTYKLKSMMALETTHDSRKRVIGMNIMRRNVYGTNALLSRRKVIRILIVMVLTFALCHFPFHARKVWQYWSPKWAPYEAGSVFSTLLTPITFLVMYSNSAVNPILYAFISTTFRMSVKDLLWCRMRRMRFSNF